jgi:DNA-binding transcriptional regulator YdaS (Cro superfamily)
MRLQDYKDRHGLSATKLARQLGFPLSTVHSWLKGEREPSSAAILAVVRATGGAVRTEDLRLDLAEAAEIERAAILCESPVSGPDTTRRADSGASGVRKTETAA